jgi:hypothetical protein
MELRVWIQKNIKIVKLSMTLLVFVATLSLSVYLGDFKYIDKDPVFVIALFVAIRMIIIAALSIFNVYGVIPLIAQTNKDKPTRQFWAVGIGSFVLILGCPLAAMMSGLGLGVGALSVFTGIHLISSARKFKS